MAHAMQMAWEWELFAVESEISAKNKYFEQLDKMLKEQRENKKKRIMKTHQYPYAWVNNLVDLISYFQLRKVRNRNAAEKSNN